MAATKATQKQGNVRARYQRWFKGVFKEATEKKKHTSDDIVDQHVEQNKNAKLF